MILVETFEQEEVADQAPECNEEAKRLIAELELDGQQELYEGQKPGAERFPYRPATEGEMFVIRELCPVSTPLNRYKEASIPLRVLQVASHAKGLSFFKEITIRHPKSAEFCDPFLIGHHVEGYTTKFYLLARWGEVLDEWPALAKLATQRWRTRMADELKAVAARVAMELGVVENASQSVMAAKDSVSYYGLL